MRHPEPDVEAFRSALARELVAVSPRPGGWERVHDALRRPPSVRRPRRLVWLLLAGPLVAGTLLAGALAAAGGASARSLPEQAIAAPPVVAVCAALAALAAPVSAGDARRTDARPRCGRLGRPA